MLRKSLESRPPPRAPPFVVPGLPRVCDRSRPQPRSRPRELLRDESSDDPLEVGRLELCRGVLAFTSFQLLSRHRIACL